MLRVVYGPFQPDLEQAFLAHLRQLQSSGSGAVAIVAPSRRLADRLQRLAVVEGGLALIDVQFHTFYSLAETLASRAGATQGRLIADPVFHDQIVDGLLEEKPEIGALFGGAARPRALASALRSSLRDLIDGGVRAEQIAEYFEGELLGDPHERRRLQTLLELTAAYEKRLEDLGLFSPSGLTRMATKACESSPWLGGLRGIVYYGFYDLTGLQLDFFEAVVAAQGRATLFFPYRRGHPAFRFADSLFEQKLMRYENSPAPAAAPAPAVGPALDALFSTDQGEPLKEGALELVSVSGARDEAWFAAKEILALVESGYCRYDQIGVVARSLEPYRAALSEIFEENAIPFELAAGEPLLRRPLAKFALNLLTLRRRDFPAAVVDDLLGSPYFARRPPAPIVRRWRAAIDRLGIHAGWLQWRKLEAFSRDGAGLELFPEQKRDGGRGYEIPAEDIAALWTVVCGWQAEQAVAPGSWAELSARARAWLERDLALPDDAQPEEKAAFEAVFAALDSAAAFDLLQRGAKWEDFLDVLEEKLRRATLEPRRRRGVRLLGAMDARGESFEVLLLLGLKEKLFPRPIQEDPILREPARAGLRHPGGYWIAPKSAGYEEERLLFYLMAGAARRRLYAVYPRSDEAGKAEVPSLYLRELCRAAGRELSQARRVPRLPFEKLTSVESTRLSPPEASLVLAWTGGPAAGYLRALGLEADWLTSGLAGLERFNRFGEAGEHDGVIGPPMEYLEELKSKGLSPSALDSLALCPFQFFAERLLGLRRLSAPPHPGELPPAVKGKIYHAVLENFHGRLNEEFWVDASRDWRPALDEALTETLKIYGWRELGVYPLLWQALVDTMTRNLRRFAAWDIEEARGSGFRPLWTEKALEAALPGDLPGLAGGLKIRGRLDRLDADATRARLRVVDYKTQWKKKTKLATLIAQGAAHQLPLYAELAAGAVSGASVESARLYCIEDSLEVTGRPGMHVFEDWQWAEQRDSFFATLAARLEQLSLGRFPINPDDSEFGHCGYCGLDSMCRKSHSPTRARSKN